MLLTFPMVRRHLWVILPPLASWIGFEGIVQNTNRLGYILGILIVIHSITVATILKNRPGFALSWLWYGVPPFLLTIGELFFVLFLKAAWAHHLAIAGIATLVLLYFEALFLSEWKEEPSNLHHLTSYLSILTIFFIGIGALGLTALFGVHQAITSLVWITSIALITGYALWIKGISSANVLIQTSAITLACGEMFVATTFLPVAVPIGAALLTLLWFVSITLLIAHNQGKLTPSLLKRYLIIGSIMLVVLLLISRWL